MDGFWKGKRVLLTGHTGFKGGWLAFWLKMLGAEVCGYSLEPNTSPNLFENLSLNDDIESVIADVRDLARLRTVMTDFRPEIVFHLAAQSLVRRSYKQPVETYATNVIGTVNLLESVRETNTVKSVVVVTTDKVYENREWLWPYRENERLGGFDPYSNSKACAEMAVSAYRNSFFVEGETLVATARAGNVIGGGDWSEDRLLPDVFRSLIFGKSLEIRNPLSIRPWQHVLEPLAGYLNLAEKLFQGARSFADAWNFGPDDADSQPVKRILEEIETLWVEPVKWDFAKGTQPHEARILKLDSTKARFELGWKPKLSLSEAISLTTDWYREFAEGGDLGGITRRQIEFYIKK